MDRIFYKSDSIDPYTNLPIFIFDTSYLPSTDLINYDAFIPTMMKYLPQEPYALVMFNCGLNKISWVWGIKFLKQFLDDEKYDNLSKLLKIYTVHDSWFVKSITNIFKTKKNIASLQRMIDSFSISNLDVTMNSITSTTSHITNSKIIRCSNLSDLSKYVDITKLKISLNIYKHNLELEPTTSATGELLFSTSPSLDNPLFYHHFYQIFNILNKNAEKVELIFHKPGNKSNTDILYQCINRDQRIWINDWDLWCIGATFKKILTDLPEPLISINNITLPIQDDLAYTRENLSRMLRSNESSHHNKIILYQFIKLCIKILQNNATTKHTPTTLSKCISHCLSHEIISSNKDRISIINRFVKNIFDHWSEMESLLEVSHFPSVNDVVGETKKNFPSRKKDRKASGGSEHSLEVEKLQNFNSYDISYDLTIDNDDEDLEYRVAFNTTNILSDDQNLKRKENDHISEAEHSQAAFKEFKSLSMKTSPLRAAKISPKKPKAPQVPAKSPTRIRHAQSKSISTPSPSMFSHGSGHAHGHTSGKSLSNISLPSSQPITPNSHRNHTSSKSISSIGSLNTIVAQSPPSEILPCNASITPSTSSFTSTTSTLAASFFTNLSSDTNSTSPKTSSTSASSTLKDVSNVFAQYPPQKYKFQKLPSSPSSQPAKPQVQHSVATTPSLVKKPVIRGRKVGELAKLFEERAEAFEVLKSM